MQSVRSTLRAEVKELVDNARDMADWHYYVRRYPIACMAVAAATGFALTSLGAQAAPQRAKPAPEPLPVGDSAPVAPVSSPSFVQELMNFGVRSATSVLTRAAMGFVSQQLGKLVNEQLSGAPQSALNPGSHLGPKEVELDVQPH